MIYLYLYIKLNYIVLPIMIWVIQYCYEIKKNKFIIISSGGLFITLPAENAEDFCQTFSKKEGHQAWVVGHVEEGEKGAYVVDNPDVLEI